MTLFIASLSQISDKQRTLFPHFVLFCFIAPRATKSCLEKEIKLFLSFTTNLCK